jgi:uncharacterized repeat protein (TIGR02543 family)
MNMKNILKPHFFNKWILTLLFFVSVLGCKKADEPVGIIGLCPEVTATDPMLNAVDVELDKIISITFNTAMDPLTINTSSVLVKQLSTSTLLVGTVAATSNSAVFTFTPSVPLQPFTNYEVTVTNKATSTFRTAMKANYAFSYTTIPKLTLSSFPVAGGTTSGEGLFAQGAKVAISAVPAVGYTFENWTDSGTVNIVSTSPNYQYTMFGNHALVANFLPIVLGNFAVNLSSYPAAGGTTTGSGAYVSGSDVTIVATPNPGYSFVNWTDGLTVVSTSSSTQIVGLSSNKTWVANFNIIPAAQLAVVLSSSPPAGGSTVGSGAFLPGTSVTIAANQNTGYTFTNWTDLLSGTVVSTSPAFTFVISTNRSLVANFSINTFTITTTAVNGAVGASPNQTNYNYGTHVQLTATPNAGYAFTSWSGDASGSANPLALVMTANKNITANFTALYTLNTTAVNGTVAKSPNQSYYATGTSVQLAATPSAGYTFTSWSGDATGTTNPLTVSMNGNKNITANFTAIIPPVDLGTIANFGAYGGNAGITNQGLHTVINNGSIGTTAASSLITGFHDGITAAVYTETPLNVGNVTGGIYTAPPAPGTSASFAIAQAALLDATTAYNSISPASKPGGTDPGAGELGGLTLAPGTYMSASGTFKITNLDLVLDAQGNPNAVWIFQTAAGLTVGTPAGARSIVLTGGALAKNVFWYVGSAAVINYAGGGTMVGTIIANSGVTLSSPGNSTTTTAQTILNGRAISLVSSVTMVNTIINNQ